MSKFTKESIERLREQIDLVDVLSSHLDLKRAGASFKALCPFHEEKTPSFIVQRGDSHYHCFGCGAHGDAIAFLMGHLRMSFTDAIESLAERFGVTLEKSDAAEQPKGPSKTSLKNALEMAAQLYHYLLLYAQEAEEALDYLFKRGIDLSFIRRFQLGYAPKKGDVAIKFLRAKGVDDETLEQAGLIHVPKRRDFFAERILFPIRDGVGSVIGFSGRKFKEQTFGGKYINTPETPLFKKSRILFGLSDSRSKITKERKAIIVEGQIDALRLIYAGFDYTVAGQGTAFGAEHVKELVHLGVSKIYLSLDADEAGREAAYKIGDLFMHSGIEVYVLSLPEGSDPDTLLLAKGPLFFSTLLENSQDYLSFVFHHLAKGQTELTPTKKNEIVAKMAQSIRAWEQPVLIYESLKKLSEIAQVPENILKIEPLPELFIQRSDHVSFERVNPDRILETDLLRWLFLATPTYPKLIHLVKANINEQHFRIPAARDLYNAFLEAPSDLLALASTLHEEQQQLLSEIMQRKINIQKAEEGCKETLRKMLMRSWTAEKEAIRLKIHSAYLSDEQALELARQFDILKNQVPILNE
jgi:DNA primase